MATLPSSLEALIKQYGPTLNELPPGGWPGEGSSLNPSSLTTLWPVIFQPLSPSSGPNWTKLMSQIA